ncbi:RNA polymerase sigma factor [Rhizohabitans arisaemae]|uniref:RNA polymerase sigma factor n=1 Tax=Rhizohabitans arisaemae TaxID=2720610 RepID=UPI0024B0FA60|nr:hypothetical protein [Rhizohabitans arisaemae]
MNDRVLVEALRARDPGALAVLYHSYAEGVYGYCRFILGDVDAARTALRDTLIVAESKIHLLAEPRLLRAWIHALARAECARHGGEPPRPAPFSTGGPPQIARNAVLSLPLADREVLDLVTRRGVALADLGRVLGLGPRQARYRWSTAKARLRDSVAAELLVRRGAAGCAPCERVVAGLVRDRAQLARRVHGCDACGRRKSGSVSVAKVFATLPEERISADLRMRILDGFTDPGLAPYRSEVAGRSGPFDSGGFPVAAVSRWPRAVGSVLAAAVVALLMVLVFRHLGQDAGGVALGSGASGSPAAGTSAGTPSRPGGAADPVVFDEGAADPAAGVPIGTGPTLGTEFPRFPAPAEPARPRPPSVTGPGTQPADSGPGRPPGRPGPPPRDHQHGGGKPGSSPPPDSAPPASPLPSPSPGDSDPPTSSPRPTPSPTDSPATRPTFAVKSPPSATGA